MAPWHLRDGGYAKALLATLDHYVKVALHIGLPLLIVDKNRADHGRTEVTGHELLASTAFSGVPDV